MAAMPIRSASGSVPMTRPIFFSLANLTPNSRASGFSGLGDFTVGKRGSMRICSGTVATWMPKLFNMGKEATAPVPWMGEKTTSILRFLKTSLSMMDSATASW